MTIGQTALDAAINAKGEQLEQWLESAESMPFWAGLGLLVLAVLVLWLLAGVLGDLVYWSTRSWRHVIMVPLWIGALGVVMVVLYRVGAACSIVPQSVQLMLEQAVGR